MPQRQIALKKKITDHILNGKRHLHLQKDLTVPQFYGWRRLFSLAFCLKKYLEIDSIS